jgi:hypothetical protein
MVHLPRKLITLLRRLSREQDASLRALTEGKTVSSRLGGYARGERVERKFFLLALAPSFLLMVADELGWPRGGFWKAWMWLSIAWAVLVIGYAFVGLAKSLAKLSARSDERFDREGRFLLPPEYRNTESATKAKRGRKTPT